MLFILGIIPSLIATYVIVSKYEDRAISIRTMNVKNQCDIIADQLAEEDYVNNTSSDVINSQLDLLANVYSGRIMVINNSYRVVKDTYDLSRGKTNITEQVLKCLEDKTGSTSYDPKNNYIQITVPIEDKISGEIFGVMLAAISTNEIAQNVHVLENRSVTLMTFIIIAILVVGYVLSDWLVKPLSEVTKEIEDITDEYQVETISVRDYTETEQITEAFNRMLRRVKTMDDSRQEFVSNVSHELKTPLTSMKVLADSLIQQEDVPAELYREFMQDIAKEIDRENGIISDLLTLVRMDKTEAALNIETVDIGKMLEEIIARLKPIASKRNIELILDTFRPISAQIDEMKLSLAFTNLIENGIKYNVDDGWVRISLNADHKFFFVTVADSGIGISEEDKDQIFERFYRADKSHSTEIEGTGLGLPIAKNIILMHHGAIKVSSKPGEGTSFQVRIPLGEKV